MITRWMIRRKKKITDNPTIINVQGNLYQGSVSHKTTIADDVLEGGAIKATDSVVSRKDSTRENQSGSFTVCPFCGKELNLPKTPSFCPYCGELLKEN